MKFVNLVFFASFGALLIYASLGLPNKGDANAPVNRELSVSGTPIASSYYIKNAYKDAHTPNIVTVILADYRGYDTLGEETVIFAAGIMCFLILKRKREDA